MWNTVPAGVTRCGPKVRLRCGYFITCTGVDKDPATGEVIALRCTYDPATRGGDAPDGRKVKATLHWVSAAHAVNAEVRLYDRLFTVEENPRLCGWGAEIVSIAADEAFYDLDGPPVRITTPHVPLPAADVLEDMILPTVDRIAERVRQSLNS